MANDKGDENTNENKGDFHLTLLWVSRCMHSSDSVRPHKQPITENDMKLFSLSKRPNYAEFDLDFLARFTFIVLGAPKTVFGDLL